MSKSRPKSRPETGPKLRDEVKNRERLHARTTSREHALVQIRQHVLAAGGGGLVHAGDCSAGQRRTACFQHASARAAVLAGTGILLLARGGGGELSAAL